MRTLILVCVILLLSTSYAAGSWTTLDTPGAMRTIPHGIDGDRIVGYSIGYDDGYDDDHGFVFSMSSVAVCPREKLTGDFNGDCRVDFADFAIMAGNWMTCNLEPQSACWD